MNQKDREFMQAFVQGLEEHGTDFSQPVIVSQKAMLASVKNFYEHGRNYTTRQKLRSLVSDGLFLPHSFSFLLTDFGLKMGKE